MPLRTGLPHAPGVYILYRGTTCIYVGSTKDLRDRVTGHSYAKLATRCEYRLFPKDELLAHEQAAINELSPILNMIPANRKRAGLKAEWQASGSRLHFLIWLTRTRQARVAAVAAMAPTEV